MCGLLLSVEGIARGSSLFSITTLSGEAEGQVGLGLLLGSVGQGRGTRGKDPFGEGEALDQEA